MTSREPEHTAPRGVPTDARSTQTVPSANSSVPIQDANPNQSPFEFQSPLAAAAAELIERAAEGSQRSNTRERSEVHAHWRQLIRSAHARSPDVELSGPRETSGDSTAAEAVVATNFATSPSGQVSDSSEDIAAFEARVAATAASLRRTMEELDSQLASIQADAARLVSAKRKLASEEGEADDEDTARRQKRKPLMLLVVSRGEKTEMIACDDASLSEVRGHHVSADFMTPVMIDHMQRICFSNSIKVDKLSELLWLFFRKAGRKPEKADVYTASYMASIGPTQRVGSRDDSNSSRSNRNHNAVRDVHLSPVSQAEAFRRRHRPSSGSGHYSPTFQYSPTSPDHRGDRRGRGAVSHGRAASSSQSYPNVATLPSASTRASPLSPSPDEVPPSFMPTSPPDMRSFHAVVTGHPGLRWTYPRDDSAFDQRAGFPGNIRY